MKHINDDTEYAAHVSTHNELARKKDAIDSEINQICAELAAGSDVAMHQDAVNIGLAIEPGKQSSDGGNAKRDRLSVLQTQSDQLRKAIHAHSVSIEQAQRAAGNRIFSANSKNYLKLADQLVVQVEAIIATSKELLNEKNAFYGRGVAEPPNVVFPEYGFEEQLPTWLESLKQAVRRAHLVQETYTAKVQTKTNG